MYTETIRKIKEQVSVLALANQYTFLKKEGDGIWKGACPHPNHNDKSPSFVVWEKYNSWACMGCHNGRKDGSTNLGSDAIAFVQWIENKSFKDAVVTLANAYGIELPTNKYNDKYNKIEYVANKFHSELTFEVRSYLIDRGLSDSDMKKWNIGYDEKEKRITFPLMDRYNKTIGFTKRTFYNDDTKYKNSSNSEIFNKSSFFYGINNIDTKFPYIRVTEGPMDVIVATSQGAKNVVATLGTAFTVEHAKVIKDLKLTPVLIFDADPAGEKATLKAIDILNSVGVQALVVTLDYGMDLCDFCNCNSYDIEEYIKNNQVTFGYMKIKSIVEEYNKTIYGIKSSMYPKIQHILEEVPKGEKQILKDYVYEELRMGVD